MHKNRRLQLALTAWLIVLAVFLLYAKGQNRSVGILLQESLQSIADSNFAWLILILIFLVRPIFLLPVSMLSAFAGYLFGPIIGIFYTLLATSASASIAYGIARYFSFEPGEIRHSRRLISALQKNSFESVLISRLTFVPGDLVNYAAGFIRADYPEFLAATVIGGLPGLVMTVMAGSSIHGTFSFKAIKINRYYLFTSLLLLIFSLLTARYLRKKTAARRYNS